MGVRDRETGRINTEVIRGTDRETLQDFVLRHTQPNALVYTDEHRAYEGMPRYYESVRHSTGEYVRGNVHTNGLESHWATLKRSIVGTFHHVSPKHTHKYVTECAGRHNNRKLDIDEHLTKIVQGADGKLLPYAVLIADEGKRQPALF